ncbi:MAG: hypothetical protein L0312_26145, partial [Acidobacteria bacterium]|nr:hypothetical protein [Acidobacteriota bacterium]
LAGKPRLRHLEAGNAITDAGLALLHEFPLFKTWQGDRPALSLVPAMNTMGTSSACPSHLFLNLKAPLTDQGLANLAGLDGLYSLNLYGWNSPGTFDARNSAVTPAGLQHLAELPNLGRLACYGQLGTDEAMRYVSAMPRLRFLSFSDPVAGDEGFAALSRSSSIELLGWGKRCDNLTGRGFAALAAMPAIRSLSGSCKNVDDEGLSALPRFPALKEINPIDVPDDGFRHVGRCTQLEGLNLMYCQHTTDAATAHIAGLSRLKTYEAWSTRITDRSLELLGQMPSLERILVSYCAGITNDGLAALAKLPRLREVVLEGLPLTTPEGAAVFPAHVQVNIVTE